MRKKSIIRNRVNLSLFEDGDSWVAEVASVGLNKIVSLEKPCVLDRIAQFGQ